MKQPLINVEEKIEPTKTPDAISTASISEADRIAWEKKYCDVRVPRGIYRFKTIEEADEWTNKMMAAKRAKDLL